MLYSKNWHRGIIWNFSFSLWSPSRGVISTEDIPITESAFGKQAVILLPTALEITDAVAQDGLSGRLSSSSLHALQVNAQHGICIVSQLACVIALSGMCILCLLASPYPHRCCR